MSWLNNALRAWKALRSVATITGHEVLGGRRLYKYCLEGSTPKDKKSMYIHWRSAFQAHKPCYVLSEDCVPGYRRYAPYCLPGR